MLLVRGMGVGVGMFQVVDIYQGREVGEPVYWKEDAERTARRLNLKEYREARDGKRAYDE